MDLVVELLSGAGRFLPATVVAAIVLFIVREVVESRRRRRADSRKRTAIRRLIGDEIERNNWTVKRTRDCILQIQRAIDEPGSKLSIHFSTLGKRIFRREAPDGSVIQMPIEKAHSSVLSMSLMDVATIDASIFANALCVSDAVKELDHVVSSMIEQITREVHPGGYIEGFVEYANEELDDCEKTLRDFYEIITERPLERHRIR